MEETKLVWIWSLVSVIGFDKNNFVCHWLSCLPFEAILMSFRKQIENNILKEIGKYSPVILYMFTCCV